jgi:SAM-dependent methyltransferase
MTNPDRPIFTSSSRIFTQEALKKATRQILGTYMPVGIKNVVEIGCGDGYFYRELLPQELKPFYKGYDNHRPSLERFRLSSPEVQVELAEADNIDLPDASVDMVIGFSAYPLFKLPGVAKEIMRVMRSRGRVFIFQDNLIGDPKGKNDRHDKTDRVEKYHKSLATRFSQGGWLYQAGDDTAEAVVLTQYQKFKDRIPGSILSEQPEDAIILAATRDIGAGEVRFGSMKTAESDFQKVKADLGNPRLLAMVVMEQVLLAVL